MKLVTHFELQKHENCDLLRAIGDEKRERQRSKNLNLVGEVDLGVALLFSPTPVLAAKEYQNSKKAAEQEQIRQKYIQKAERERTRTQKLVEKKDAKLQEGIAQAVKRAEKEGEQARKKATANRDSSNVR